MKMVIFTLTAGKRIIGGKRTTLIRVVEFSVRVQLGYFRPTKMFIHRTKWTTKMIFRQKISLPYKTMSQQF